MAKQQQQQPPRRPAQPTNPNQTQQQPQQTRKPAPAPVRRAAEKRETVFSTGSRELIYGRRNLMFIWIGLGLVVAGLVAMLGGAMPSPEVWDENIIYSFRRITLAPLLMVAGFVTVIFGIFRKNGPVAEAENTTSAPTDAAA